MAIRSPIGYNFLSGRKFEWTSLTKKPEIGPSRDQTERGSQLFSFLSKLLSCNLLFEKHFLLRIFCWRPKLHKTLQKAFNLTLVPASMKYRHERFTMSWWTSFHFWCFGWKGGYFGGKYWNKKLPQLANVSIINCHTLFKQLR